MRAAVILGLVPRICCERGDRDSPVKEEETGLL
jgi:hypothetical protein